MYTFEQGCYAVCKLLLVWAAIAFIVGILKITIGLPEPMMDRNYSLEVMDTLLNSLFIFLFTKFGFMRQLA